jgi:Domain of unknown function (DUF4960)/Secretion system C-terminal sorting domain
MFSPTVHVGVRQFHPQPFFQLNLTKTMTKFTTPFRKLLFACLLFLGIMTTSQAQHIVLLGDGATVADLPSAEQKAYNWALAHYGADAAYASFSSVASAGLPASARVVWFHFEDDPTLPASADAAAANVGAFIQSGGGMLVSGFATSYVVATGVTTVAPTETINNDPAGPDVAWGVKALAGQESNEIFDGLTATTDWVDVNWGGYRTISTTTPGREALRWWTGGVYPGTPIACMPWWNVNDPNIPVIGKITSGAGAAITCTAPGFNWVNADINGATEQATLQALTANMLNSLVTETEIILLGSTATLAELPVSEQNAYNWALSHYGLLAQYRSFDDVAANGIESSIQTIWFHLEDDSAMPANAAAAASAVQDFVAAGGGLFTSSFATSYLFDIGASPIAPTETISNDPAGPDVAWGVKPLAGQENHPFFEGMTLTTDWVDVNWGGYRTIGASVAGHEAIRWWTGGSFPGNAIGCMPWWNINDPNIPIVGSMKYELGTVAFASGPGYQWLPALINEVGPQANLEQLTVNILNFTMPSASLVLVGDAATIDELPTGEKNAYNWAINNYAGAQYRSFAQIAADGIPAETEVMWFHYEEDPALPASADAAALNIDNFVHDGGGILLSGFATGYVTAINATTVAPTETINNDPAGPDVAWGVKPFAGLEGHPVFGDMTLTTDWVDVNWGGYRTIGASVQGREAIRWWTGGSYPGQPLACMPWWNATDLGIPVIGLITAGDGGVVTSTAPGYHWVNATTNELGPQANLEQLTANMLELLRTVDEVQGLNVALSTGGISIPEGQEAGKVINIELSNVTFKPTITPANWTISNLPAGITYTVASVDNKHATITLAGTAADYDTDITNFSISIPASEFLDLNGDLVLNEGVIIFDAFVEVAPVGGKVALIGTEPNMADLGADEKAAYEWALASLDTNAVYFNIVDLVLDPTLLDEFKAMWIHYDEFTDLPLLLDNVNTENLVKNFRNDGGGIFLSGTATQYLVNLDATTKGPNQVEKAADPFTNPDHWGFLAKVPEHPIFLNLPQPFKTLYSQNGLREDTRAWWNLDLGFDPNIPPADRFDGIQLASTEWDASFVVLVTVAEFEGNVDLCQGDIIAVGAGAFDWHLEGGPNEDAPVLEQFTTNILNYLRPDCTVGTITPAQDFALNCYPNPASNDMVISFDTDLTANTSVDILDITGRQVAVLMQNTVLPAGSQQVIWHINGQPDGMYFYKVTVADQTATGKVQVIKQ